MAGVTLGCSSVNIEPLKGLDSGLGFLLEPIEWEESEFVHNASGPASSAPPSPFAEPKTLTHFLFRQPKQSYDEEPLRTEEERAGQGTTLTRNVQT
jgi:hypothetical protein